MKISYTPVLTRFIRYSLLAVLLLIGTACESSQGDPEASDPDEEEWMALFNSENLDGWTPKIRGYASSENSGNTFRVEDGMLTVRYDEYDDFDAQYGHLVSDTSFSHYIVAVEYRFIDEQAPGGEGWAERNNGIMVHSQSAETMTRDQDFPVSIEVQLLGEGERPTANLCTPGTHVVMDGELITEHASIQARKPTTAISGCVWRPRCSATRLSSTGSMARLSWNTQSHRSAAAWLRTRIRR